MDGESVCNEIANEMRPNFCFYHKFNVPLINKRNER